MYAQVCMPVYIKSLEESVLDPLELELEEFMGQSDQ